MTGRLQDRVAIVTGAGCVGPGWGNGRAVSVRFAEEGAKIFAVDLNPDALKETIERTEAAGGEITGHICDITDGWAVTEMVKACVERFGRVDILVNNVGGSAKGGPVEMPEEVWDRQVDFNLKSVFLTCKKRAAGHGRSGRGCHRQHLVDIGPALDRRRPVGLCGHQGRRDPVFQGGSRSNMRRAASG